MYEYEIMHIVERVL